MAIQTSYTTSHTIALQGAIADSAPAECKAAVSSAAQAAGTVVLYDTTARPTGYDPRGPSPVRVPTASGDVTGNLVMGVVVRAANREDQLALAIGEVFDVCSRGRVWVKVEEAVAFGDPVYVRYAAGGLGRGYCRMSAGTSEAAQLAGARFVSAASANGLAQLEIQG